MKLHEKTLTKQIKFSGHIISVRHDKALLEGGETTTREVVQHPGGVCIAALTERNTFLMVEQFRYAQGVTTLEFVAGKRELNEPHQITALRELEEETGYTASEIEYIGDVFPSPAYLDEVISLYLATNLTKVSEQNLDEFEYLNVYEYSLEEISTMIESNEIKDLKTIALAYQLKVRNGRDK